MPLDNAAKLSDIITALQNMEGINAKADLASVIGSPATAGDTMATLVGLIQQSKNDLATKMDDGSTGADPLQELVGNLVVGKKWASGDAVQSSGTLSFKSDPNTNYNMNYIQVSGLEFQPNIIVLYGASSSKTDWEALGVIWRDGPKKQDGNHYFISSRIYMFDGSIAYINNDGFRLPIHRAHCKWIAFE